MSMPLAPHKLLQGSGNSSNAPQSRQSSNQQPSAHQLRVLVHQIQMAVQAGHLNPQILNQPLAPQTLILLNQLLQQIKQLQSLQQQHSLAPRGNSATAALMNVTVNITKTKQHIQNLQNQISAQQANYLKAIPPHSVSHPQASHQGSAQESGLGSNTVQEMFNSLNLMGGNDASVTSNGSRLAQWKLPKDFSKAPGAVSSSISPAKATSSVAPNLLLDNGPWSREHEANGGWPESSKDSVDSDFGIPEFEPGKPWKGTGLKNPDEDPNLTPGSVAQVTLDPMAKPGISNTSSNAESSNLSTPQSTWSIGKDSNSSSNGMSGGKAIASNWGNAGTSSNLTQIGQDLWGSSNNKSGTNSRIPPGLGATNPNQSWPQNSNAGNGWSGSTASVNSENTRSETSWLLLKNLTPQIDGSTLKTLCMQHGPLQHFDLYLNHSIALVMYSSSREAAKVSPALSCWFF